MKYLLSSCLSLAMLSLLLGASALPVNDRMIIEPALDKIVLLKNLAAGRVDIIADPVEPKDIEALPAADRGKLLVASVPFMSWSLLFNPAADGSATGLIMGSDGIERFNPFGIAAVRRSISRLIDRRKVVDEICSSRGAPMFLVIRPDAPGNIPWTRAAIDLGYRERGDQSAAADLQTALGAAAADPAMHGRLRFSNGKWLFDGSPVSVRFLIRADDPDGRLLLGHYVAGIIERQGIEVEALEYTRAKCFQVMEGRDPADLGWSIYTEGWGAGQAGAWHEEDFVQMYCPFYGNMPGAGNGAYWHYSNERLDALGEDLLFGRKADERAHEAAAREAARLALDESVRVFVAGSDMALAANAARLGSMPLYDLAGGFGPWTWRSAVAAPGADRKRTLRIGVLTRASVFQPAWNPVGVNVFGSGLQRFVMESACDFLEEIDPATGISFPNRYRVVEVDNDTAGVTVPGTALVWDGAASSWRRAPPGGRASARLVLDFDSGPWQDGHAYSRADFIYQYSLYLEWCRKDSEDDGAYDGEMGALFGAWLPVFQAMEPVGKGGLALYGTSEWSWNLDRLRNSLVLLFDMVPWPIDEALENLVLRGGRSGTSYSFNPYGDECVEVDLAAPKPFADLLAEVERLDSAGQVPRRLEGFIDAAEAHAARKAVLAFMRLHGHALDSNGPWLVDRINTDSNTVELVPFDGYPFPPDRARRLFSRSIARIDLIDAPMSASGKAGFDVSCRVSSVSYPEGRGVAAGSDCIVKLTILAGSVERSMTMESKGKGEYGLKLAASLLKELPQGRLTLVVEAQTGTSLPDLRYWSMSLSP